MRRARIIAHCTGDAWPDNSTGAGLTRNPGINPMATAILLKRTHEPASRGDGKRVLVDRLWPRGKTKQPLKPV